jgi:ABC-type molybdenum transport system ATPase subunit/photorepair protein PhrA
LFAPKNEPFITMERITLCMGDRMLLPATSWEIRGGENWAIPGPNGSGKSALTGAVRGDVPHVRGKLTRPDPEAEGRRIGYVSFELQEEILVREERREEELIPCIHHVPRLEKTRRTVTKGNSVPEGPGKNPQREDG